MLWAPRLLAAATIWSRYRERTSANVMGGPLFEYATWPLLHQPSCLPCKRFQNSIDTRRVVIYCHNLGMLIRTIALLAITAAAAAPTEPEVLKLSGDVEGVHDPVIIKQKGTYYVFCTGVGHGGTGGIIPIRTSKDLIHWTNAGTALPGIPDWGKREIPGARDAWAPDISYYKGKYHLYYALSTFGSQNSAIGLATNPTLDPADPKYNWTDEGMVLRSFQDKGDWNAIDPNLVVENEDTVWLNWGSYWSGIKMRRLDPDTGKPSDKYPTLYSLCSRPREAPIHGSVEAPFIVRHDDLWYLDRKSTRLNPDTGKPSDKYPTLYSLCSRPREAPIHGSV